MRRSSVVSPSCMAANAEAPGNAIQHFQVNSQANGYNRRSIASEGVGMLLAKVLTALVVACATLALGKNPVLAWGYRPNDPCLGAYTLPGPRWYFAAAYYQTYHNRRHYRRYSNCLCRPR